MVLHAGVGEDFNGEDLSKELESFKNPLPAVVVRFPGVVVFSTEKGSTNAPRDAVVDSLFILMDRFATCKCHGEFPL